MADKSCNCRYCTSPTGTCPPKSFAGGENLVNIAPGDSKSYSFSTSVWGAVCYSHTHSIMVSLGRGESYNARGNWACSVALSGSGNTITVTNNSKSYMIASYFGII